MNVLRNDLGGELADQPAGDQPASTDAPAENAVTAEMIDAAAKRLLDAKAAEKKAESERLAAESAVIALIGAKREGATSQRSAKFKLTTTGKLNRSFDAIAWAAIKDQVPEAWRDRIVKYDPSLVLKEFRALETADAAAYLLVSEVIETKPAKTSVDVEVIKPKEAA